MPPLLERIAGRLKASLRLLAYSPTERKLKTLLWHALASEQHRLPPEQVAHVSEFVEYEEYELALDQLQDALDNLDVQPSPDAARAMEDAAAIMRR